jgi:hypothetical protein
MKSLFTLLLLIAAGYLGYRCGSDRKVSLPPEPTTRTVVAPSPNTIVALRRLAELKTAEFAIERVIDIRDKQSHLFGLVQAEDALLLIAGGRVSAGIDLTHLKEGAIVSNWEARRIVVELPSAQILDAHIDEQRTYVHSRRTDSLAARKETLESDARREAERELERGALSGGILKMANENAKATVESLLHSLGFVDVQVRIAAPESSTPVEGQQQK